MTLEHRHHARCACGSTGSSFAAAGRPFVLSGTARVYERSRPFTIEHIALDLALHLEKKSVDGTATLDVVRVDPEATAMTLDAVGFDLRSVELEGAGKPKAVPYVYDGEQLVVKLDKGLARAKIRVTYSATPRRGLYFLAPDEHVTDRPRQVWTQCQDEDARHIFPCHDKPHVKQTTELRIRVPKVWFALSNGELVEERDGFFHWKMNEPHPSYLFTLVAGEFSKLEAHGTDVPVTYFVPRGREADGERTFKRTPEMLRHFGELTGVPYPWNKYAQIVVSDFIFGGMENTTATTMYEHVLIDHRASIDISSDDIIAHELAHQWFGDFVTCRDWSQAWLNEGFATFMEHMDREKHLGRDEYDFSVRGDMEAYFAEAHGRYVRPIVCQDYEAPIDIFDRHLYEKGSCVLHMLRRSLGDTLFWRGVSTYLNRHARGVVETRDLMRALEEVSGRGLEQFFEQWVYRAGHPELEVKIEHDGEICSVTVKQVQHGAQPPHGTPPAEPKSVLFAFDLALDIALEGGVVQREVRRIDEATHTFAIRVPSRPRFVVVDPELAVLAEIRVEAPGDMLRRQIVEAATPRGRSLAAPGLGKLDDPPSTAVLAEVLAEPEQFWGLRAEAAAALGNLRSDEAFKSLAANVTAAHPKVRRAVAHALGHFKTPKAAEILGKVARSDASYLVEAEAARALGSTKQSVAFDTLVDIMDRPSWADVIRVGAIDGLGNLRDERATPHIAARTRYGVPLRGRRAAILAMPKVATDRKARETLEDLLDSSDPYLRTDVVRALGDLGDAKARRALNTQLERELDGRVRRRIREVLRDLGGTAKRETERLKEELEALRSDHASLKARLGKLEAMMAPAEAPAAADGKPHKKKR